jgi:hypothetical protein
MSGSLGLGWEPAVCCLFVLGRSVLDTDSCSSGRYTASGPSKRGRGGRRAGGAAVGLEPGGGDGSAVGLKPGGGDGSAVDLKPGGGDGSAVDEVRERVGGGFSRASSSLSMVYHRSTAEAENVGRCLTLLKKAGGGLCKTDMPG